MSSLNQQLWFDQIREGFLKLLEWCWFSGIDQLCLPAETVDTNGDMYDRSGGRGGVDDFYLVVRDKASSYTPCSVQDSLSHLELSSNVSVVGRLGSAT